MTKEQAIIEQKKQDEIKKYRRLFVDKIREIYNVSVCRDYEEYDGKRYKVDYYDGLGYQYCCYINEFGNCSITRFVEENRVNFALENKIEIIEKMKKAIAYLISISDKQIKFVDCKDNILTIEYGKSTMEIDVKELTKED